MSIIKPYDVGFSVVFSSYILRSMDFVVLHF